MRLLLRSIGKRSKATEDWIREDSEGYHEYIRDEEETLRIQQESALQRQARRRRVVEERRSRQQHVERMLAELEEGRRGV